MTKKENKIVDISELPGVGPATAEKLKSGGLDSFEAIATKTPGQISDASGLSESAARKIIDAAKEHCDMGFHRGSEVEDKRSKSKSISTGVIEFDKILDGGIKPGYITEFYGEFGSSKTQFSHMLSVQAQITFPNCKVGYIDTENTFVPKRIRQFAKGVGADPDKTLKNIMIARAFNSDHQMLLVEKIENMIKEGDDVKLIIVDSLTAHFRAEFLGRGSLNERQQRLNKHMHMLSRIADLYNVAIYVTNQVMSKPDAFFGDPTIPIGGHIVAHSSAYRVYLRRGKKGTRVAKLVDAPDLPDAECVMLVEEERIIDA